VLDVECQTDAVSVEAAIARTVADAGTCIAGTRQPTLENVLRYVGQPDRNEGAMTVSSPFTAELLSISARQCLFHRAVLCARGCSSSTTFMTGSASMTETFRNMGILLLTVSPLVSMRLFSAEWSGRTMELLATLPLTPWAIVLGKFLGAVTILLLMTAGTVIDLVPLYLFGNPQTTTIIAGYIGFVLLGMACLAVGQFFSALTHNQIVAALITILVLLSFWLIGHLQSFRPPTPCAACSATCRSLCTSPISCGA
jgi:hypothetical protein